MAKELKVARGLTLPIDVVGEVTSVLAKRGAGKTNTAKVFVEEALDAGGVQVVVLDPVGAWWALRAGANGKPGGGYDIAVLGGMQGDLPLEPTGGKLIAETVVDSGQSMVLDVSGLDSDGAMQRFAYEFAERLYTLKQANPTPLLLVLEEADEFAPQNTQGANVPRMVGAYNRIAKRGRGRGVGMLCVTQRSAAFNKNVLDQSDTLVVMRTVGPRDRAAIEGWVKYQQAAGMEEVIPSLASLGTGEAWFWTPERGLLKRTKVRKASTFDSTSTPRPGEAAVEATVKPIDLEALGEKMQATVERVKAADPAELRRRILELERELRERPETEARVERVEVPVEVSVVRPEDVEALRDAVDPIFDVVEKLGELAGPIGKTLSVLGQRAAEPSRVPASTPVPTKAPSKPVDSRQHVTPPPPAKPARPTYADGSEMNGRVNSSEQKILDALAWYESVGIRPATRVQVGLAAKYKATGGRFVNLLGALKSAGLIDYPQQGTVELTDTGRAIAAIPDPPASNEDFQERVIEKLDSSQEKILRVVLERGRMTRAEVAEATGYEVAGGRFVNLLGSLRTLGLIDYPVQGEVAPRDVLYPYATA